MIRNHFKSLKTVLMATALLLLSACNGDKLDPDLVDSITGRISVSQVIIDQDDFEMTVGENATLTATVLPNDATDKTLVWSSSKEDVLMVSSAGKAMALSPGKSIITATAGNKTSIALKVGESETLMAAAAYNLRHWMNKNASFLYVSWWLMVVKRLESAIFGNENKSACLYANLATLA